MELKAATLLYMDLNQMPMGFFMYFFTINLKFDKLTRVISEAL